MAEFLSYIGEILSLHPPVYQVGIVRTRQAPSLLAAFQITLPRGNHPHILPTEHAAPFFSPSGLV